jgi:pimeloyl-ACP methyl ester carboxylesterase
MSEALFAWRANGSYLQWRGHRVHYKVAGTGPVLLLVHGYPVGSYDWHAVWDMLTAHYTVIAPDMLGFGFSDKPPELAYGLSLHADVYEHLLATLGVTTLHVMAHDLGVTIVQELLARRERDHALPQIASIVLLNGAVCPDAYRPRFIQRLLVSRLGRFIGPRVPKRAFERTLRDLFGQRAPPTQALINDFWALLEFAEGRRVTHATGAMWLERMVLGERLLGALLRSPTPLRLVNGGADPNSGQHMIDAFLRVKPDADMKSPHWRTSFSRTAHLRSNRSNPH